MHLRWSQSRCVATVFCFELLTQIRQLTRGKDSGGLDGLDDHAFGTTELVDALMVRCLPAVPLSLCMLFRAVTLLQGVSLWEVEMIAEKSLSELIGRALYTFLVKNEVRPPHGFMLRLLSRFHSDKLGCLASYRCHNGALMMCLLWPAAEQGSTHAHAAGATADRV